MSEKFKGFSVDEILGEEETGPNEITGPVFLTETKEPDRPLQTDEGWTEWVLSQLSDDEVYETERKTKHPTVAGLRRFIDKNFNIHSSVSNVNGVFINSGDPYPTSTVVHKLRVSPNNIAPIGYENSITEWSGCATAGPFNNNVKFTYPTECAETRAKGRAYTSLLGLKTCTKDEINEITTKVSRTITAPQIKQLDTFCKRLNIDVIKYINSGAAKYKKIEDVPSNKYNEMFDYLNLVQQAQHDKKLTEKDKERLESYTGYNPNWR